MSMIRLIYVSELAESLSLTDIQNIWSTSIRNNKLTDIHGLLLFKNNNFLQVLEGDREILTQLFFKLKNDKRHRKIKLLGEEDITHFEFTPWFMGYIMSNEQVNQILKKHISKSKGLKNLTFRKAYKLLKELAGLRGAIIDIEIPLNQIDTI